MVAPRGLLLILGGLLLNFGGLLLLLGCLLLIVGGWVLIRGELLLLPGGLFLILRGVVLIPCWRTVSFTHFDASGPQTDLGFQRFGQKLACIHYFCHLWEPFADFYNPEESEAIVRLGWRWRWRCLCCVPLSNISFAFGFPCPDHLGRWATGLGMRI